MQVQVITVGIEDLKKVIQETVMEIVQQQNIILLEKMKGILPQREEKPYSIQEITKKYRVSRQTLWRDTNAGLLHPQYVGSHPRYTESDLQQYLNRNKKKYRFKKINPKVPDLHFDNMY